MLTSSLRRPALDGLRGLAALTVLVHHAALVAPAAAQAFRSGRQAPLGTWPWLMTYTPLHIVWAGGEAVLVFFVLSGLVLALPAANGRATAWTRYYPQRAIRLYLPVGVALGFSWLLVYLVPRHPAATSSWWLAFHVSPVGLHEVAHDALVVRGSTSLNTVLWSLQWEIIFSALLPVFVVLLVRVRRWLALRTAALVSLILISGPADADFLHFLPTFGFGVLLAQNLPFLDQVGTRFDRQRAGVRPALGLGVVLLLTARWWFPSTLGAGPYGAEATFLVTLLGACLLVWIFASTDIGRRIGTQRHVGWLGKRSFSLYLVHEPIVVTVAYLFGGTTNAALVLVLALPASLLTAEVFGRLVETPSHRLAKRVGELKRRKTPAGSGDAPTGLGLTPLVAASR